MDAEGMLSWMLAAACTLAGAQHLLAWAGRAAARDHAWFALACLATAAVAGLHAIEVPLAVASAAAVGWFAAASGFIAAHAPLRGWQRHVAGWAPLLLALACVIGPLEITFEGVDLDPRTRAGLLKASRVIEGAACVLVLVLASDGARSEWKAGRRCRAAALSALGLTALLGWSGLHVQATVAPLQTPALSLFFLAILAMAVELAATIVEAEAVSQRQRLELAHASRLAVVGELTASIAHEINQPLGAILANADAGEILLERGEPPLEEIRKILADIRRDGVRASDVIRQVRALVRKREPDLQQLDANAIASQVVLLLESESLRRRVPLTTELSPRAVQVQGDRALLEQVLINLVLNAMDAVEAAAPGENAFRWPVVLAVSTTPHGDIEWRIVDAGTGIPADKIDHLFDSFYTSKPHGMGLGLSIARSILEAHGGRIQAQNNPRGGATFSVTLPPCQVKAPRHGPAVRRPA